MGLRGESTGVHRAAAPLPYKPSDLVTGRAREVPVTFGALNARMQRIAIPYRATGRSMPLVLDVVEGHPRTEPFRAFAPDRAGLEAAMHARSFDPAVRATLIEVLRDQYHGIDPTPEVAANLQTLAQEGSLTVTTGHQLCLFGGPLYVPFKILNVLRLARDLSTPQRPVVPVFWMASEDHDLAEVDHATLNGRTIHWNGGTSGAVGRMQLQGIADALAEAAQALGDGSAANTLRALLGSCYREELTLAEATRRLVHGLFGRFGLLILDGDDARLKRWFAPLVQEEVLNEVTARAVRYADDQLKAHYTTQAHAREINVFHLVDGRRARIVREGDRFRVLDGGPTWSMDELLRELQAHPERFSPNVLLRPLYQETILPNVAYVGGGGELAYWLQLRWVFQAFRVPMPAVLLRTSASLVRAKDEQRRAALGLSWEDLFGPVEALRSRVAAAHASFPVKLEEEERSLRAFYDALASRAAAADPTLKAAVQARAAAAHKGLEAIQLKLVRAAKRQQADVLQQLDALLHILFPSGLQERRDNILPFLATHGTALLDELLQALDPLDPRFSVLVMR